MSKAFMEDFYQYCIGKKWFIVFVMLVGVSISVIYNFLREDVYESKMTVSIDSEGGALPIEKMVYKINQKVMFKSIDGKDGVLGEDYSNVNVYANDRKKNGWVDIYVHGKTPDEAKNNCEGIYEHIKYYSENYKNNILEQAHNEEYVSIAKNMADEALKGVLLSEHTNLSKDNLYNLYIVDRENISSAENDFLRKEYLYRNLLKYTVRALRQRSCDFTIVTPPNLPAHPASKKYSIVVVGSFMISLCFAIVLLLFSFVIKRKKGNIL